MTLVIGTDEAGYGPNLGPLVVAATAWLVDREPAGCEPLFAAALEAGGIPWADSKRVYRGGGLAALEAGALVGIALAGGGRPADAAAVAGALGVAPGTARLLPASVAVPRAAAAVELDGRLAAVGAALDSHGIRLESIRCRVIGPAEFNLALDRGLNKADLLSRCTLELAAELRCLAGAEPAVVWCDRQGGRRRYAALVARHFGQPLVHVVCETAERSAYEVPAASCRVEFNVGGESRGPVALASMAAKYVRELSMLAFNEEWCRRVPGLAPTAGYPVDALRWRREAAAAVERAGVPWDDLWRRA